MARLLITGGAGFIGANFVQYWLARHAGDRVVVLDALTYAGNRANLDSVSGLPQFRFVQGDVRDTPLAEQLLRDERLDTIVHFAAESHVDRSIEGPDAFIETNVVGTHSLLKAARRLWLDEKTVQKHRFHHVSTDEVYGSLGPEDAPFTERTPYAPNSPYAASKAAADHLVRAYHHTYGLQTTISNCSNNYGPHQFAEKLIPVMIRQLLLGKPLPIYGDGRHIRDWLHVEDHCRGIEGVLERGIVGNAYNIGGRSECENIQLVRMLCSIVDDALHADEGTRSLYPESAAARGSRSEELIIFVEDRPGHDRRYAIDCSRIEIECGFKPIKSLAPGLRETVQWYLRNPAALKRTWQREGR
jgi:dTDP-glucose 4,6-dehydratase